MQQIKTWYKLLEGAGVVANDSGPAGAPGALTANVTWLPFYHPPGVPYGFKGVTIAASLSNISSAAAAGFNSATGSIEMLCRPTWNNADGLNHYFWDTSGGPNRRFLLWKHSSNLTYLFTDSILRGSFTYPWTAGALYHIVLSWPTNVLYVNKSIAFDFADGTLGLGAANLFIGDNGLGSASTAFAGDILYFIARDLPLTPAQVTYFYNFFIKQYIAD